MDKKSTINRALIMFLFSAILSVGMSVSAFAYGITQTGIAANNIPIKWDAPGSSYKVTAYHVYAGNDYSSAKLIANLSGSTTSYKVPATAGSEKYIRVTYDYTTSSGYSYKDSSMGSISNAPTLPSKVSGVKQKRWWYYIQSSDIVWNRVQSADGYNVRFYNSNGGIINTAKLTYNSSTPGTSLSKTSKGKKISNNSIYMVDVQAYTTFNGKTYTSVWSPKAYLFTSPTVKSFKRSANGKKLTVKWQKVAGATSYSIYISTKPKSGYKLVKTVNAKKTSCTIKKFNKKKISKKKKYYCYVVTNKKVGNTTYPSGSEYYWKVGSSSRNWL